MSWREEGPVMAEVPSNVGLANASVAELIDQLSDIAEGDLGYMPTMSGDRFLPLDVSKRRAVLFFQTPPAKSETLHELVKRGAMAIPQLVAHLADQRPTKITLKHDGGLGGIFFKDEYDFNSRTATQQPLGVNRNRLGLSYDDGQPNCHTVTVGDLCFVAIGQIVNRNFNAARYQPTACIMINSPTYSERLRRAIETEWGELTPERHVESLTRDLFEPDFEWRREGACLRLGFYYPEALEPLAVRQLAEPWYDSCAVYDLIRKELYPATDASERRTRFNSFVLRHHEVTRQGMLHLLFQDLRTQEGIEQAGVAPPKELQFRARECLMEFFEYPSDVKSSDRPFLMPLSGVDQANVIDAVAYFPTPKIDQVVREILRSTDEDYLAGACIRFLTGRDVDTDIRAYVEKHLLAADAERRQELVELLDYVGMTQLHVAVAKNSDTWLETLIRAGADVNARAANGKTPLHVAAKSGSYGGIRILLKYSANPNIKDDQGRMPVQLALCHLAIAVQDLIAGGAEISDILVAAIAGRDDLVKRFVEDDRSTVHARIEAAGDTALHIAARRGDVKVAEILLAHGADVNATAGEYHWTPLHHAVYHGQAEVVKLLLAHDADPHATVPNGSTPKNLTREREDDQILRLFE